MLRYLPPSGVPITLTDIFAGLLSCANKSTLSQFRADICRYFGVKYCFLASSGRAGLSILFQALHGLHPDRDQVVLPAFTSFSVPSAVANAGLSVALYDLVADTLSPNIESMRAAISERTLCIVVCHLYGYPCDMDTVLELAREKGIPVVDDAAQAMGATYKGRLVGTMGNAGLFSLSRGKNISTVDGGIVVTDSPQLASELEKVALEPVNSLEWCVLALKALVLSLLLHPLLYGIPARIPLLNIGVSVFEPEFQLQQFTPFQAGIGRRMLQRLRGINQLRRQKATLLMERLVARARFPGIVSGAEPVFLRLPMFVTDATEYVSAELGVVRSYPTSLGEIELLQPLIVNAREFPEAKKLSRSIVTLPTHQFVGPSDVADIVNKRV